MTPLTLKGDIMMLPGSSFSCWYNRLPNTCRDWYGVGVRIFCCVPAKVIWRSMLLPCSRWRQQPPGWLRWSCPTWCDCSLEEMEELAADSDKIWFISNRKNRLHKIPRVEWTGDDLPSWPLTTHYHDKPTIMRAYMADLYRKVVLLSGYQLLS